jgi:hypothetical protein
MLVVGLDVDDVLFDFDSSARRVLRDEYGEDPGPDPSQKWEAIRHQVSKDAWDWLWDEGPKHGLFDGVPTQETLGAVAELSVFCDLRPITTRSPRVAEVTRQFCQQAGLRATPIHVSCMEEKAAHDFDVWIDDAPGVIEALVRAEKHVVIFDQPWNRDVKHNGYAKAHRARGWEDVVTFLREMTVEKEASVRIYDEADRDITSKFIEDTPLDNGSGASFISKGDPRFHAALARLGELHDRKQSDYGRDMDPFANVRASEEWGTDAWIGSMMRATDKIRRLQTFARRGWLANESVLDAFDDLAVYSLIGRILFEEAHP